MSYLKRLVGGFSFHGTLRLDDEDMLAAPFEIVWPNLNSCNAEMLTGKLI